jgi:hypothetical protein
VCIWSVFFHEFGVEKEREKKREKREKEKKRKREKRWKREKEKREKREKEKEKKREGDNPFKYNLNSSCFSLNFIKT